MSMLYMPRFAAEAFADVVLYTQPYVRSELWSGYIALSKVITLSILLHSVLERLLDRSDLRQFM